MTGTQVRALVGALLSRGVAASLISEAVSEVIDMQIGDPLPGHRNPLVGAFAREQARRLLAHG